MQTFEFFLGCGSSFFMLVLKFNLFKHKNDRTDLDQESI